MKTEIFKLLSHLLKITANKILHVLYYYSYLDCNLITVAIISNLIKPIHLNALLPCTFFCSNMFNVSILFVQYNIITPHASYYHEA